jgi:hypothetical protein
MPGNPSVDEMYGEGKNKIKNAFLTSENLPRIPIKIKIIVH